MTGPMLPHLVSFLVIDRELVEWFVENGDTRYRPRRDTVSRARRLVAHTIRIRRGLIERGLPWR